MAHRREDAVQSDTTYGPDVACRASWSLLNHFFSALACQLWNLFQCSAVGFEKKAHVKTAPVCSTIVVYEIQEI